MMSQINKKIKLAIFDVDKTIIEFSTLPKYLRFVIYNSKDIIKFFKLLVLNILYYFKLINGPLLIRKYFSLTKNIHKDELFAYGDQFTKLHINGHERKRLLKLIENFIENKTKVILISAGLDCYLSEYANSLGVDLICNQLVYNGGLSVGKTKDPYCFGEDKVLLLRQVVDINQYDKDHIAIFSDSITDLPLFSLGNIKTAVFPDPQLLEIAKNNNYLIF
ncbi:HAD-IB family phosphatase [Candidatus Woesearchaeota archaeon]|jgi:phosphatidylglycerophosphatase C|nr:HAD-IB family phosphatase [Candidatus Woesearchaeota archaeon]